MKVFIQSVGQNEYTVRFKQGVQTFTLGYQAPKKEAMWMARMLRIALKNYSDEIKGKL